MRDTRPATLFFDVAMEPVFEGSCGIVAHYLRKALKNAAYDVESVYHSYSKKNGRIPLPSLSGPRDYGVRIFFEELFPRAERTPDFYDHPNIAWFNLLYLGDIQTICKADGLLFISKYLMECYRAELLNRGLEVPHLGWTPFPLHLFDFQRGYPSFGGKLSKREIRELRRESYLGHEIRPGKADPFATLSLLYHLNRISRAQHERPFYLVIPKINYDLFREVIARMPIPKNTMNYFIPIPQVDNPSAIALMGESDFSLCYDSAIEGFGFYPLESIYLGSPVYTNGAGNLRHLLPPGHGIFVEENVGMHFGTPMERVAAFAQTAERIHVSVTSRQGRRHCERGRRFLRRHHVFPEMCKSLQSELETIRQRREGRGSPESGPLKYGISPYLRVADWTSGRFVTDLGPMESARPADWLKCLGRPVNLDSRDHPNIGVLSSYPITPN